MNRREFLQAIGCGFVFCQGEEGGGAPAPRTRVPVNSKFARKLLSEHRIQKTETTPCKTDTHALSGETLGSVITVGEGNFKSAF